MTSTHTFGLVLGPTGDTLNALISEHVSRDEYKIFCIPQLRSNKGAGQSLKCALKDNSYQDSDPISRQISLSALPKPSVVLQATDETFEAGTVYIASPSSSGDDPDPVLLFENNRTVVEEISRLGKGRVRKKIHGASLHTAARQWERETRTVGRLSHPHIVKVLPWDLHDWSIDFEHGGKDLASLRNATNMFNVAINLPDV
jgi:hypothetical protein